MTEQTREKFRISTRKDDKSFRATAYQYDAFLNGELMEHCHTADEGLGYVEIYETDSNGNLIKDQNGDFKSDRKYGTVEIRKGKNKGE